MVKGFGRRSQHDEGGPLRVAGVRKPWEETAGRKRLFGSSATDGDLKVVGRARVSLREAGDVRDFVSLDEVSGLGWRRRHEGAV